ncbi:DsbA family protein [Actinomadura xylanilytica]|uniref:DsbA family protein n=1 Tax=Actinomadura xylanilytica TaxID=887459 RepID=UPI00255B3AF6|nr:thioredoxin domain-containing protein [Actinomadura xylanilytica]MDL4770954.1 thioredoxin domain-containing protein [Actinomadura xylanilytica]
MSKPGRDRSARQRLAAERSRQAARERRRRLLLVVVGAVAAAAVVVVIVVVVLTRDGGGGKPAPAYTGALAPTSRQSDGAVVMARPGVARPVLQIFEDFQCPICKDLEDKQGPTIKELAAAGKVKTVYRPFQLFQQEPLSGNSRRAANAAACAPADRWIQYHDQIYAHQPAEGDKGFADPDLITWAGAVGISGAPFTTCVDKAQKTAEVDRATAYAERAGVTATPWLTLDGAKLSGEVLASPDALRKAIEDAGRKSPGGGAPS